eukprot:2202563-Pyramimonas_sp.AAC.1
MVPFAETVMWKEPGPHTLKLREKFGQGIWVGRSEATNCHLILTRQGAFEARTIRRLPPSERHDFQLLLASRGAPSRIRPPDEGARPLPVAEVLGQPAAPPAPAAPGPAQPGQRGQAVRPVQPAVVIPPSGIDHPGEPAEDAAMEEPRQGAKAERDIEDGNPLEPPPKKTRGRPVTRVLPLPTSKEFTPGCSGCLGTSYKHSKFCKERNKEFFEHMEIDKLATKVQRDDERELLRSIERAEKASK